MRVRTWCEVVSVVCFDMRARVLLSEGHEVNRWVSFASNDVSVGDLYAINGFVAESEVAPDYWYAGTKTQWKRMNKQGFTKARFKSRADLDWQAGTERAGARGSQWPCSSVGQREGPLGEGCESMKYLEYQDHPVVAGCASMRT
jgi:hypothetical protein